ncbi:MAG: M23 family metallopeptidase [Candidatus Rokubacteria bacterium]|nr:M23 family metallopeptidase [Candidatus Rokubacteria bacterium]
MRKPKRFHLLIVAGDSTRILRLNFPRWIVSGGLMVLALGVAVLGAIAADYVFLKRHWAQTAWLRTQVAEQQSLIDRFQRRLADIRTEVASWRELHAKIWEPFGPDEGGARKSVGIGGRTELGGASAPGDRVDLSRELELLAANVYDEGQSLRTLERFISKAGKVLAAFPSRWPVRGPVNSEFGTRVSPWSGAKEFHGGIDIAAERGTLVKAPSPGEVAFAGSQSEYGLAVVLDHGHDIRTLYGHLQKILVTPGQKVERGQVIGLTGNTGKSSGPHLHYEIAVRGQSINPRRYLWD